MNDTLTPDAIEDTIVVANHVLWAGLDAMFTSHGRGLIGESMTLIEAGYRAGRMWAPPDAADARWVLALADDIGPTSDPILSAAIERLREHLD